MNTTKTPKKLPMKQLTLLALFIAVELAMKFLGLGTIPIGPLNASLLSVPVAIGAILLGPVAGLIMGAVFGLCSLWDAISGAGGMTAIFFQLNPFATVLLCVGTRTLMGWVTGLIFKVLKKIDRTKIFSYYGASFCAPALNTLFFMGYICLVFYGTEFIQSKVAALGAANPFMFVVLLVGLQGVVEMLVCTLVAGTVSKGVAKAMKLN